MKFIVLTAFTLGSSIFISQAQADPTLECSIQASSQIEIGACLAQVATNVDASLEQALSFASDAANELDQVTGRNDAGPALNAAQLAWAAYRDQHCDFVGASFGGGSGTGIAIQSCRIELGRTRVSELMRFSR